MKVNIIHLGIGNIGKKVIDQIFHQYEWIKREYGIDVTFCGLFTSQKYMLNSNGIPSTTSSDLLDRLHRTETQKNRERYLKSIIESIKHPFILIDTTASSYTSIHIKHALQRNGYVVLANKKPLSQTQYFYTELLTLGKQTLFFETVVGAGLPVIQTIKNLIATGDEIIEIRGCMSGTLGYIFSEMEKGKQLSEIVTQAMVRGIAEPDPRVDLSGADVARKALILSRLCGWQIEFEDVQLSGIIPSSLIQLQSIEFFKRISEFDKEYSGKVAAENKLGKVLRYCAVINAQGCRVGLQSVAKTSDIGSLIGTDNLFIIKTKRYFTNPLIIKGPGAGIDVTAAGVFGDILSVARIIKGASYDKNSSI